MPEAQRFYREMLHRLQLNLVWLIFWLGFPISLVFGASLAHGVWVARTQPPAMLTIHIVRFVLLVLLTYLFLRRDQPELAWLSMLAIGLLALLLQIWLLREASLIIFAVYVLACPALVLPARLSAALVAMTLLATYAIARLSFPVYSETWHTTALLFVTLMVVLACIGFVLRRFVRQSAQLAVERARELERGARLEQQMLDLRDQVELLASLEHDLRQPLRAIQGHLSMLAIESPAAEELSAPAMAASGRAERLVNNLLDQARFEASQQPDLRQPTDLNRLLAGIRVLAPGLARYYTDPPVPISVVCADLPPLAVDQEQLERALLNLLDNALAHSPPDGTIELRAELRAGALLISVRDQGPGIPPAVVEALGSRQPLGSRRRRRRRRGLGLAQVYHTALAHGGSLSFPAVDRGTLVLLQLPVA